jgi:hypothetical protein
LLLAPRRFTDTARARENCFSISLIVGRIVTKAPVAVQRRLWHLSRLCPSPQPSPALRWRREGKVPEAGSRSAPPRSGNRDRKPSELCRLKRLRNCSGSGAGVSPAAPGVSPALPKPRARRPPGRRDARPTT